MKHKSRRSTGGTNVIPNASGFRWGENYCTFLNVTALYFFGLNFHFML